jgi:eukaryotic-like serine/threonine-protein kinase
MANDDWEKIKEVVESVLSRKADERDNFLDSLNLSVEMRDEIDSLIAFDNESADFLDKSAVNYSQDFFDDEDQNNLLVGQQIGAYTIHRELGFGGMGAVYLAERSDGKFEQKVALKFLKRELNTAALRRRFKQEREILGSLEHPNIARLIDAGTTDDKIPYFAMEYVEGLPIDDYCRKNNLNLNQRLDLFRIVCSAVDFAHRNLIVHRDLKPSNVLVSENGTPKLLDFGISKILSEEFDQVNSATVTKLGVMTPSYASPEQLQSKSVTTATDIYSLGVILYELLSGHRPFEAKEGDVKQIYQAVLENEPPFPSAMIETFSKNLKEITEAKTELKEEENNDSTTKFNKFDRETRQNRLNYTIPADANLNSQSLRGDLDNIVLKAIRKEPERRYSSAENFSEDIKKYLRGLPVSARPNTFSYRAEKFVKRNRAAVFAGGLIFLAIFGGIAATLWQTRIAQIEGTKAEKRFGDVRALANSFLFEFSPLIENLPGSTPARKLLVTRALEYLDNLSQEADNDWKLQGELSQAYEKVGDVQGSPYSPNIGDTKGALQSYEKARTISKNILDREPDNPLAQNNLANLLKLIGELHSNGGDYQKAVGFYDQSLALHEKLVAVNPQDFDSRSKLADILRSRGLIPFYEGDNKKAIEYYNRAKDINEQLRREQPENPKIAEQYAFNFVSIGEAQGWDEDFEGGAKNLQIGLDLLIPLSNKFPNDIKLQRSLMLAHNKRAENHQDLEEFEKSVELFSKGVEISINMLKADPQSFLAKRDVAMSSKKLAQALDDAGRSKESLEKLNLALKMFQEMNAADPDNTEYSYDVANTRFSIGETYLTLKDFDSALKTFQTANEEFQIVKERNPENIYAIRMSSYNLEGIAKCFAALSEKQNRQEYLQKTIENYQSALENFKKLKSDGKLGEVDSEIIGNLEKEIEKTKAKQNR